MRSSAALKLLLAWFVLAVTTSRSTGFPSCIPNPCQNNRTCRTSKTDGNAYCICGDEFTGETCQYVNPCHQRCLNGGQCNNFVSHSTCTCPEGFTGLKCETRINRDCRTAIPCYNNGTCIDGVNGFTCRCPPGWTGNRCSEYVGACSSGPCENGATCQNAAPNGSYLCICMNGWTDERCTTNVDDCDERPCLNGGTCHDKIAAYHCQCPRGKTGLHCELDDLCASNPCHSKAVCDTSPLNQSYVCRCAAGWNGTDCSVDVDECEQSFMSPCEHDGECVNTEGSFFCRCQPGYTGPRCENNINECLSEPCFNFGSCIDDTAEYKCICLKGFSGINCEYEIDECQSHPCSNNATCVDQVAGFECICRPGFGGLDCAFPLDRCLSFPCLHGGSCTTVGDVYICQCPKGTSGRNCELSQSKCSRNPCQHGSECTDLAGDYLCECRPGFTGRNCETNIDDCEVNACINGDCFDGINEYKCYCYAGFTGVNCELDFNECVNDSSVCRNGGTCENTKGSFLCVCSVGYSGPRCEIHATDCKRNPCKNGRVCARTSSGHYICRCLPGYYGDDCQHDPDECQSTPCRNGATCQDFINLYTCRCASGFSGVDCEVNDDDCTASSCLHGGTCEDGINGFSCRCPSSYTGSRCELRIDPCPSRPCLNYGACTYAPTTATGYQCRCDYGFTGARCEVFLDWCHDLRPCLNGGTCMQDVGTIDYRCECPTDWSGKNCDARNGEMDGDCVVNPCSSSGAFACRRQVNDDFRCECRSGWTGRLCDEEIAASFCSSRSPCRNGGECRYDALRGGRVCSCVNGFTGRYCEVPACANLPCLNGGTCRPGGVGGFSCGCFPGTSGRNCQHVVGDVELEEEEKKEECVKNECSSKTNDGICHLECNTRSCDFDGGDCTSDDWQPLLYRKCNVMNCSRLFNDSRCDDECNNEECLYDGNDCLRGGSLRQCDLNFEDYCRAHYGDGHCDKGCDTAECGWDGSDCDAAVTDGNRRRSSVPGSLVFVVLVPPDEFLAIAPRFLRQIGLLLNGVLTIQTDENGRKMVYPWHDDLYRWKKRKREAKEFGRRRRWRNRRAVQSDRTGTIVYAKLDSSKCSRQCFTNTDEAGQFLQQSLRSGWKPEIPINSVRSTQDKPPAVETSERPMLMYIVISGAIFVIIVVLALSVGLSLARKRSRPSIRAHDTWFPDGFRPVLSAEKWRTREPASGKSSTLEQCSGKDCSDDVKEDNEDDDDASLERQWAKRQKRDGACEFLLHNHPFNSLSRDAAQSLTPPMCQPHDDLESSINRRGPGGLTPLMVLAMSNNRDGLQPTSALTGDSKQFDATQDESSQFVYDLCTEGASVDSRTDFAGETSLHLASRFNCPEVVVSLLAAGADANAHDDTGRTPLDAAVAADATSVVKLLLDNHLTKVNSHTNDGTTCLMSAARLNMNHLVQSLLKSGASVNATDKEGRTALHWAAAVNNLEVAKLLLQHNANRDVQDASGQTPLFLAVKNGQCETAKLLLENLANSDLGNDMDLLPRDVAAERCQDDIVELLDSFRSRPLTSVTNGKTKDVFYPSYIQKKMKTTTMMAADVENKDGGGFSSQRDGRLVEPAAVSGNNEDAKESGEERERRRINDKDGPSVRNVENDEKPKSKRNGRSGKNATTKDGGGGKTTETSKDVKPKKESIAQKIRATTKQTQRKKKDVVSSTTTPLVVVENKPLLLAEDSRNQTRSDVQTPTTTSDKKANAVSGGSCVVVRNGSPRRRPTLYDENRNVARDELCQAKPGNDGGHQTLLTSWQGSLSPPDSTTCFSPNTAGGSSVGSPDNNSYVTISPIAFYPYPPQGLIKSGIALPNVTYNCQPHTLALHQSARQNWSPDGVNASGCHLEGSDGSHLEGVYFVQQNERCLSSPVSRNFHTVSSPYGLPVTEIISNRYTIPSLPVISAAWNAPVQYHVTESTAFDACLTPSSDASPSQQIE